MDAFLFPRLSEPVQALLRISYGVLQLLFLLQATPVARWFFVSERWRGYAKSDPRVDRIQNPRVLPWLMAVWFACAISLIAGFQTVTAALINLMLCRYFFVHMRWKGVLRGGGAPGHMNYWVAAAVFLLEYGRHMDPGGPVLSAALLALKVDFALIMLTAGMYKFFAGYPKNHGMELGMINPWWGYWGAFYKNLPPGHWIFRTLNHLAWGTEVVAAVLMLFPPTEVLGALLIMGSFAFILTHIRLGWLCEMVVICGLIYFTPGGWVDYTVAARLGPAGSVPQWLPSLPAWGNTVFAAALWTYAALLPFAYAGLWYNFMARRRLAGPLQTALERYTVFFGIILWRVFTIDLINFFVNVRIRDARSGAVRRYGRFDRPEWSTRFRYWHVSEFVCFCSVFTTLKYYASNRGLFRERLLRYARTIPCGPDEVIEFEYVAVRKYPDRFAFEPVALFTVDPERRSIEERMLADIVDVRAAHPDSPVHEGMTPGSYAPAAR